MALDGWIRQLFKDPERFKRFLVVGAVGLGALLLATWTAEPDRSEPAAAQAAATQRQDGGADAGGDELLAIQHALQRELAAFLSQVAGAGRVEVLVTLKSGPRTEYLDQVKTTETVTRETDASGGRREVTERESEAQMVMAGGSGPGGDAPVVVRRVAPEIAGVVVVADGAADSRVKHQLTMAVATYLGIPSYKVRVMARGAGE